MITRSSLVHRATQQVPSRFFLVRATAKATRLIHRQARIDGVPGDRVAVTINQVLAKIGEDAASVIDPDQSPSITAAEEERINTGGANLPTTSFPCALSNDWVVTRRGLVRANDLTAADILN